MARFTLPRDLYHGKGSLAILKELTGKRAMVCVGGSAMRKNGFLDKAIGYLKEAGMEVELIEGVRCPDRCGSLRRAGGTGRSEPAQRCGIQGAHRR